MATAEKNRAQRFGQPMAAAYFENGVRGQATFELIIRNLPADRGYLLTAGLEQVLDYVEGLSFSGEQIEFLRRHPAFAQVKDTRVLFLLPMCGCARLAVFICPFLPASFSLS